MGKPTQNRIIRRRDIERFLSQITPHPSPKVSLEQYTISEAVAATILYIAAYTNADIIGKRVLDLGCGTGRLALAASYLGAQYVVGIDIDKKAIETACENSEKTSFTTNVQWIIGDIDSITGSFDTVLQNPPFGVQNRAADRKFLEKALEVGRFIYSLHNHPHTDKQLVRKLKANSGSLLQVAPSPFIEKYVESHSGLVKAVYAMPMTIPRIFSFHTKTRRTIIIDLYLIKRND
jgi:putative methylase